jgi:hypothetical protein
MTKLLQEAIEEAQRRPEAEQDLIAHVLLAELRRSSGSTSLRDIAPTSVGCVLKPLSDEDDLLAEMLDK